MKALDLDPAALNLRKYDPDQPRVPAGQGRESGRWKNGTTEYSENHRRTLPEMRPIILAADHTTPNGFSYDDKTLARMNKRGVTPEEIDEAVRSGDRIDAINKSTGNPAIRYVNPKTGKSVVIDSTTNDVVHVGDQDFEYGPKSGISPERCFGLLHHHPRLSSKSYRLCLTSYCHLEGTTMTHENTDVWQIELPHDIRNRAYRASNGEWAWTRADATTILERLEKLGHRVLGIEVWLPTYPGPTITGHEWDEKRKMSALAFITTFDWDKHDDGIGADILPYFVFTLSN